MSTTAALAAVVVVGLLTYAARAVPIVALADRKFPPEVERALKYVGPAVLSALIVSLLAGGEGVRGVDVEEVAAVLVGCVVAVRTKNLITSLVAGMIVLWILVAVF